MHNQEDHVRAKLKARLKRWKSHDCCIKKQIGSVYSYFEKQSYVRGYRHIKNTCLPDFLGIGVPQAGTTWLYQNLKCHPDIFFPQKEVRYFDAYFHRSLSSYSQKFLSGHAKIKGDISPNYCILSTERIRFIRAIMPNVRLILVMRDPVDRAWSAARRIFSRIACAEGKSFEETEESQLYAFFQKDIAWRRRDRAFAKGVRRGEYRKILENWFRFFTQEQLCVIVFDDIITVPQAVLRTVFRHLGISINMDWNHFPYKKIINKNPSYDIPTRYKIYLEDIYYQDVLFFREYAKKHSLQNTHQCSCIQKAPFL